MADNTNKEIEKKKRAAKALNEVKKKNLDLAKSELKLEEFGLGIQAKLLLNMKEETSALNTIKSLRTAISDLLMEDVKTGNDKNLQQATELQQALSIYELSEKEGKLLDKQKTFLEERNNVLKNIFGITSDIEAAVLNGTFKALIMNKAFENISANVSRMSDGIKDGVTNLGLSGASAFQLQGNIEQARFSMTGLLYGSEAVAASGKAIAEKYGSASMATADLIEGVTQLSSLGLDASEATDLASVFKSAGVEATEVKGIISDIAKKEGISAKKAMEGMNGQMSQLVGKSESQLKTIIASNAHLVKQGTTMSQIKDISKGMLDIESSMKAGAKARMIMGRDMNTTAVRDAAVALRNAHTDKERAAASDKLQASIHKGVGGMEKFAIMSDLEKEATAAAYSMSTDELATMLEKKKVNDEIKATYGEQAELMKGIFGAAKSLGAATMDFGAEMGKVAAQTAVMNLMQGKGTGIGSFFTAGIAGAKSLGKGLLSPLESMKNLGKQAMDAFKGKSPVDDIKEQILPDKEKIEDVVSNGDEASGKGGIKDKLKDLADGLKEMGNSKVFAGIGAVALAGPAFIIALPAIPFLLFMGKVKLKELEDNFLSLASGLIDMSETMMGSVALGVFGIAAIPSILAIPFLLFMGKVKLKELGTNFTSLSTGLVSMSATLMGSLALAVFGIAAIPSIAAIPFLLFMGLVPLAQLGPNFTSLSLGLVAMSSTFMGSLALAAFGVAALIAIPSLIFLAGIALLGAVGSAGLIALGVGLTAFGATAPATLIGIGLIALLGLAMIPFAYALSLVTPLVEVFGNIIIGVFAALPPIIEAVANGFVTMMGAVTPETVLGIMALGPALVMASIGMIAFSAALAVGGLGSFFGGGIIDDITELAMIGPQLEIAGNGLASITTNLSGVTGVVETLAESLSKMGSVTAPLYALAGGLMSISAGLGSIALASILAIPGIGMLMGLAVAAPALIGLGELFGVGGGDSTESTQSSDNSDSKLIDAINGLRGDIQSQPILISVDGKVVSEITKIQSRQGVSKNVYRN